MKFLCFLNTFFISTLLSFSLAMAETPQEEHEQHQHHHHHHGQQIWSLSTEEIQELDNKIEEHKEQLLKALALAADTGVSVQNLDRPFVYDSDQGFAQFPRSVLSAVILESLQIETLEMEKYVFCAHGCAHSLLKDTDPEQTQLIRSLWPQIRSSFTWLWKDIPMAIWNRIIHGETYMRSLKASLHYKANAYGAFSMLAGGATFALSFALLEIAEGPLHLVCQANYLWSAALATAVASWSRDIQTQLAFAAQKLSFAKRLWKLRGRFQFQRGLRNLQSRMLYRIFTRPFIFKPTSHLNPTASDEQFTQWKTLQKISHKEALNGPLHAWVDNDFSLMSLVAADSLLWADLVWKIQQIKSEKSADDRNKNTVNPSIFQLPKATRRFLIDELHILMDSSKKHPSQIYSNNILFWQDLHASLSIIIKLIHNNVLIKHIQDNNQSTRLSALGRLDQSLRRFDQFMNAYLQQINQSSALPTASAIINKASERDAQIWVQNMLGEWISQVLESDFEPIEFDDETQFKKWKALQTIMDAAIQKGEPIQLSPNGEDQGYDFFEQTLFKKRQSTRNKELSAGITDEQNSPSAHQCSSLL